MTRIRLDGCDPSLLLPASSGRQGRGSSGWRKRLRVGAQVVQYSVACGMWQEPTDHCSSLGSLLQSTSALHGFWWTTWHHLLLCAVLSCTHTPGGLLLLLL